MREYEHTFVRAGVHTCMHVCMSGKLSDCLSRVCVRAFVHTCVRACMHAYISVCMAG